MKMFIINDETKNDHLFPADKGRGLDLTGRPPGYAYAGVAEPFPRELLIPRGEWQARIKEQEERKTRIPDLCDFHGIKVKNQERTNFCWANAPTHCVEIIRGIQNQGPVSLSPASVAAPLTNFRNVGGFGKAALESIIKNGIVPVDRWPANAIDRRYYTEANRALALRYRADEWWELEPRNLDQTISCLLRGIPVSGGFDWWGHQVTLVAAAWVDGAVAALIDNSWGAEWGTNGRGILQGARMLPDDATAPRTAIAA